MAAFEKIIDVQHPGSLPPFPATLTTPAIVPAQLAVVWTLILQSESEGPALISCAAKLLKGDLLHCSLLLAPSWCTAPKDLGCGHDVSMGFR
jgi:hypothetical protein